MGKRKAKEKQESVLTYGTFLLLLPCCTKEHADELTKRLWEQEKPKTLCGKEIPDSLNAITYGTLDDLQSAAEAKDPLAECVKILLDVDVAILQDEDVNDVFGFMAWVTRELERINKLFAAIKPSYSPEEREAGIESLNFGSFGVLDWYAKRQHIANQNEVRNVAWVRIYQCMKNDNEQNEFERRLSKVYERKSKRKK